MKAFTWMRFLLAVVVSTFVFPALGQSEQWLEYKINTDGNSYRWLDLSTNAPAGITLPKLGSDPMFAYWSTPLDPKGGRWMCFERTKKSGPYNRVYVDTTGNGRLDDKKLTDAARTDATIASFDPIRVTLKGEDGPIAYHLVLQFYKFTDETRLLISSGGSYEGKVDFGGTKKRVTLIDGNVNGIFNDALPNTDCDRISIDDGDNLYLGRLLEVDKKFYRIEVARDGAFVKVKQADDVAMGQVRVPEEVTSFTAVGENGHFVRKPAKGEFTLPSGKYKIQAWEINRKDAKGVAWKLSGYGFRDNARFEVVGGKTVALQVGEPVRAVMTASQRTNNPQVSFNLSFRGRYDESIQFTRNNQTPPGPKLTLASADGTIRHTNKFEFG